MKENWTYKKLGEVADNYRGLTYAKGDETTTSSKIVLRSNNINLETHALVFDELKCLQEDFVIPEEKKLKKDSIFICMSNGSMQHLGKVAFVDKDYDYAFGGFMGLVVPKKNIINPKFVYYAMLAPKFLTTILIEGRGANINNLKFSDLSKYPIPVPPLSEQQSIVRELDLLNDLIAKKRAQVAEYDQLQQSLFYTMFGDPVTNEKGWEVKKLGEVAEIASGYTPKETELSSKGDFPYFKISDMNTEGNEMWLSKSTQFASLKKHYPQGAIVFPKNGAAIATNKKRILAQESIVDLNTGICTFTGNINTLMAFYWFLSLDFHNYTRGGALPTLDIKALKMLPFPLPPLPLQQEFARKVEAIEALKEKVNASIKETETLLAARMDYYFG